MRMRWAIGVAAMLWPLWSGSSVTLEEAATRVGESVTFTSEVKAVSISPKSRSTYLNFGDSYPRQTLSVKIPVENQRIVDDLPRMIGRTVQVTGTVESTPTGPIVVVTDPKQLEVQPLEAGNVLEENGEGAIYNQRVGVAIRELLAKKDYGALEKLAVKWRDEKTRNLDGQWKLPLFFDAFTVPKGAADKVFTDQLSALQAWGEARPKSLLPAIASAELLTSHAWAARGNGFANTVSETSWRIFAERLAKARELLGSIRDRSKEWPEWYSALQTVALGEQWPEADYEALFAEAVGVEPEYEEFYFKKAYWLLPRWHGKEGDWEKFALNARKKVKNGDELYARICWSVSGFYDDMFSESAAQWPLVKAGFEAMLARYPQSLRDLNFFGLMAGKAGDRETCGKVLTRIGSQPDTSAWVTWENVNLAEKWTKDPKAPRPVIFGR